MEKRRAIYPGSFDPVTYGHLDLIQRAHSIFDEVIVVVAINADKRALFSVRERVDLMKRAVHGMDGVCVESMGELTAEYAVKRRARAIIRGLRATSDFDYEFQMAITNRRLSKQVDTVFLMPSEDHFYLSSKLIKEIATLGGEIRDYVPGFVADALRKKIKTGRR
ncbi:MAG: pantetheine-phosphate adenylyltransferase [Candidatus Omnitrophota bacterium]|jgi:pantetheine-phosphate adenylyltransferase